ncbi:MAG: hypothetical protein ABIO70_26025 [Pseudomonadota bacterium]
MPDDERLDLVALGAPVADLATGTPAGSIAAALLQGLRFLTVSFQQQKAERALDTFIESLAVAGDLPRVEAEKRVRLLLASTDPKTQDALYACFKAMFNGRSEAAWPYIARLTSLYVLYQPSVDAFFKRASWLLERCEDEDVKLLVEAMQVSRMIKEDHLRRQETRGDGPLCSLVWKHKPVSNTGSHQIMIVASPSATPGVASSSPGEREGGEGWARLIALIREARIGYTDSNDQQVFTVEDNTFFKLMDLMLPGS